MFYYRYRRVVHKGELRSSVVNGKDACNIYQGAVPGIGIAEDGGIYLRIAETGIAAGADLDRRSPQMEILAGSDGHGIVAEGLLDRQPGIGVEDIVHVFVAVGIAGVEVPPV